MLALVDELRDARSQMVGSLPADFRGKTVTFDCTPASAVAAGFWDELVRVILVEGEAGQLVLTNISDRHAHSAEVAARSRGTNALVCRRR